MEPQQRSYSCGPAAVRAVLYILGHNVQEATVRKVAKTTKDGTDQKGLIKAIEHYGHRAFEKENTAIKEAWHWLRSSLGRGKPVILCVDQYDHWVAAVGSIGAEVLIFDPLKNHGRRKKYSGLLVYDVDELAERWRCLEEDGKYHYYGIAVR